MKKVFHIFLLLMAFSVKAQDFRVEILNLDEENSLIVCPKTTCVFSAKATLDGQEVAATFLWDFDNGDRVETQENTVNYIYQKGGAYIISVKAVYNDYQALSYGKLKVGVSPYFSNYYNDIDKNFKGICLGSKAVLTMPLNDTLVEYFPKNSFSAKTPQTFYSTSWKEFVMVKNFNNQTITSESDIKFVRVKLVHTNSENLKISLFSPDNKEVVLKDFSDKKYFLGIPQEGKAGTLYNYTFSLKAEKKLNSVVLNEADDNVISEGEYLPEESFENFLTSPINGQWTLVLTSKGTESEGYVSDFEIVFDEERLLSEKWNFFQKYDLRRAVWSGKGISATRNAVAECTPKEYGTTKYTFTVSDDFSCVHDTAVFIEVEKTQFSGAGDSTIFIGDEINFESKTSWANACTWTAGDDSKPESGNPFVKVYYEKGLYQVILENSDLSGCSDRDTQTVKIVPRPLEVKEVNIFTPDGNGQNDVFTFFNEKDSFLKNGGLTKMPANIRSIKGKIYNVLGQVVYKWDEVEASVFGWDGTIGNNGSRKCPPGTYFYDIVVFGKDGNSLNRSGTIFLYRQK